MIPTNGRPFLQYLLEQVRDCGIREIVLCTGYLGQQIRDFFGDGAQLGISIRYSHGPVEWETGTRLRQARGVLAERFLLLYSDNFIPFDLQRVQRFHDTADTVLTFLAVRKTNGNVRLREDGIVDLYDPLRLSEGLTHVELGYMITDHRVFDFFPDGNCSFSSVLEALARARQLSGFSSGDTYHSISDAERWRLAERYLAPKRVLLIDRDGVINEKAPQGTYVDDWSRFRFIESTVSGMRRLAREGYSFVVISNQAGIERGMIAQAALDDIHTKMIAELRGEGVQIAGIYVCPHHWNRGCACRKPAPGMLFQASRDHLVRLDRSFFIGDDPRDCQAAYRAGARSIYLGPGSTLDGLAAWERPCLVAADLSKSVDFILEAS